MQVQINPQKKDADIQTAYQPAPFQKYFTVKQFSIAQPAFTSSALRNLIFKADSRDSTRGVIHGNGLLEAGAIIRIGRKVLINGENFMNWVREQNCDAK